MKKRLFLANLVGGLSPLGFVLSCTNASHAKDYLPFNKLNGFKNLIANYKYHQKILQAQVTNWKDGDTIGYRYWDPSSGTWVSWHGGKSLSLRISFIDTPEYHVPSASDPEKRGDLTAIEIKWARAATEWAAREIPKGSKIRIWTTGIDGYGRTIGSIFYNSGTSKGFNDNFAVNIIRQGYSFPMVANKSNIILAQGDETTLLNYLALPLYSAWKEARENKVRLFGLSNSELSHVYKKHGVPSNKLQVIETLKLQDAWLMEPTFKKYKIYK